MAVQLSFGIATTLPEYCVGHLPVRALCSSAQARMSAMCSVGGRLPRRRFGFLGLKGMARDANGAAVGAAACRAAESAIVIRTAEIRPHPPCADGANDGAKAAAITPLCPHPPYADGANDGELAAA